MLAPLGPQTPEDLPFARLGAALLEATAEREGPEKAPSASVEVNFLRRLEPLCARVDLGALELWLPRRTVGTEGALGEARVAREWKPISQALVELERRWCDDLGEFEGARGEETARALETLLGWLRRAPAKSWPAAGAAELAAARAVRSALLDAPDAAPLAMLLAPDRAHFLALIGAAGLFDPNQRQALWLPAARRSLQQPLSPSLIAMALHWGPMGTGDSPYLGLPLDPGVLRQHVVHGGSHLLSNRLLPTAPVWLQEGLALLDTVSLAGGDETLCSGYSGRPPTLFDGWREVPSAFFAYTRMESSPYRTGGSADLFVDELRKARRREGFAVLDLDRGQVGLLSAGPFLATTARVPDEARIGPHGLKEGFAELFRAYCGAFAAWLSERDADGQALLRRTLRALRARGHDWDGSAGEDLPEVLLELTGRSLGDSLDPARDLEGEFQAWLQGRR